MATGASNADLAVILVDARKGVLVQTRRHSLICSLLGIRHVVVAVNKIDLVDFAQDMFDQIVADYAAFAAELGFASVADPDLGAVWRQRHDALRSDTPWYRGPTLLEYLETIDVDRDSLGKPFRFPVQWVNRPNQDFRGYAGTVASGQIKVGEPVVGGSLGANVDDRAHRHLRRRQSRARRPATPSRSRSPTRSISRAAMCWSARRRGRRSPTSSPRT